MRCRSLLHRSSDHHMWRDIVWEEPLMSVCLLVGGFVCLVFIFEKGEKLHFQAPFMHLFFQTAFFVRDWPCGFVWLLRRTDPQVSDWAPPASSWPATFSRSRILRSFWVNPATRKTAWRQNPGTAFFADSLRRSGKYPAENRERIDKGWDRKKDR